jgi:hypothetical protein
VQKVQVVTGTARCLQYAGISQAQGAALLFHAQVRLQAANQPSAECPWLVMDEKNLPLLDDRLKALGWTLEGTAARLGERSDRLLIFRPSQPQQPDTPTQPAAASN